MGKTWSRGTNSRLLFGVKGNLNLSIGSPSRVNSVKARHSEHARVLLARAKRSFFSPTGNSLHYCLHFCSLAYELTHRRHQRMRKLNSQVERVG